MTQNRYFTLEGPSARCFIKETAKNERFFWREQPGEIIWELEHRIHSELPLFLTGTDRELKAKIRNA